MTTWVFAKLAGAAVRRDPNEAQPFKTEQAEEGEHAGTGALVREILQNCMDASAGRGPVRIRLALPPSADLPARERLRHHFHRLQTPLEHREIAFDPPGVPLLNEGLLVCEDFGTCGLGGDPLLSRDPKPGPGEKRQDFFWLWRNIGRSGKTGDDLGRWGLGKTVYRAAIQIGCMLGSTVREEDGRELLMGQAVLKIHDHDGREYVPEGYWCAGRNDQGLPLPIEDERELSRFRDEWKLSREGEPGLSVVVPYVAPELDGSRLLQAVCVHFFLPILRRELVVELVSPQTREVRLDGASLGAWCERVTIEVFDGVPRTFDAAVDLSDFDAPPDAAVVLEATCAGSNVISRFESGSLGKLAPPDRRELAELRGENVFFSLKVIDRSERFGRIPGVAENVRPLKGGEKTATGRRGSCPSTGPTSETSSGGWSSRRRMSSC